MKDAAKDTAPHGDWHSILRAECFGDDISRPCQPGPDPRDDEAADELRARRRGSRMRKIPASILAEYQQVLRWRPPLAADEPVRVEASAEAEVAVQNGKPKTLASPDPPLTNAGMALQPIYRSVDG